MVDSPDSRPVPWSVTALDVITCLLLALAVSALVTGTGPHGHIAGIPVSLTSEQHLLLAALFVAILRHVMFRRPGLPARLRTAWAATVAAAKAVLDAASPSSRAPETRASRWLWPAVVIVLFCLPLFVGLGRTDLENDEAIYSFAVDRMVQSGDWMTPKSIPGDHQPFLEKPPLKIWMVAAPIRLGLLPHDEFGLRFWDAMLGSIAFLYVFAIGRRLAGPVCGAVAVLALFVHDPLIFVHGLRNNEMEAALFLAYCGSVYHFLAWRSAATTRRRRAHVLALALYFVLGFMTKFVAVLFLPIVLGAAMLLAGDLRRLWRERGMWLVAGGVAFALISPWFIYQHHQVGAGFWQTILGQQVFTRFTAYLDPDHVKPWHFYFSEILGHLDATQVAPVVRAGLLLLVLRALGGRRQEAWLILLWFVLPIALMSLGTSKLYHYAYPYLPPLALAAGYACSVAFQFGWSITNRAWPSARKLLLESTQRAARPPALTAALLVLAVGCIALAAATYSVGQIQLRLWGVTLLRNASVIRPTLLATLALVLTGRVVASVRLITVLLVLALLPSPAVYRQELTQLPVERHPLRSLRQCLEPMGAPASGNGGRGPGVWAAGNGLNWPACYYLGRLGPWERDDSGSDAIAYMHLYAPARLRPVMLSHPRYDRMMRLTRAADPSLIQEAARNAGIEPAALAAAASRTLVMPLSQPDGVILLPGPYAACGAVQQR